jgi:hypothetical protein
MKRLNFKKIARWLTANRMAVNVGKTKFLIFHRKTNKLTLAYLLLMIMNLELTQTRTPH